MSRLSVTTAFAPPGPRSLAIVISRWRRSIGRSFMAGKGRDACVQEQNYCRVITHPWPPGAVPCPCLLTLFCLGLCS